MPAQQNNLAPIGGGAEGPGGQNVLPAYQQPIGATFSTTKVCRKCLVEKQLSNFHNHRKTLDGKGSYCKECALRYLKQWKVGHPNRPNQPKPPKTKLCRDCGTEITGTKNRLCDACRAAVIAARKIVPEGMCSTCRIRPAMDGKKACFICDARGRRHRRTSEYRARVNKYYHDVVKNNPQQYLSMALRRRLREALLRYTPGSKVGSFVGDLGCTLGEFRDYIESKFQPGMTWENRGQNGWHLDHIIPLASFNLSDRSEFVKASHFTNYQPLWAVDNYRKGDSMPGSS